jgi:hypothetical protein
MEKFDEIKKRLLEAAEIIKQFPESLHPRVFDRLFNSVNSAPASERKAEPESGEAPGSATQKVKSSKTGGGQRNPKRIVGLDLGHKSDANSFEAVYLVKAPTTNFEFNALAIYYLSEKMGLKPITPDHLFTCYDAVGRKVPEALGQSLRDTDKKGYVDASDLNDLKLPPKGRNLVLHDLPAKRVTKTV